MGTSSDHTGDSGGAWTAYKRAATSYAKHGGIGRAGRVLKRHVAAMGGATGASHSAEAGRIAGGRAGSLLVGLATVGLERPTLERLGLQRLIGSDRYEVIAALLDFIGGEGGDRDAAAARDAACDLIESVFGDVPEFEQLAAIAVDSEEIERLLLGFLANYVVNRAEVVAERLNRYGNVQQAIDREQELFDYVSAMLDLQLSGTDPLSVDWAGSQGDQILRETFDALYSQLED